MVSFGRVIAPDKRNFLACARSLGDGRFKQGTPLAGSLTMDLVPAEPDVASHTLGPEDRFVVLASDGVWDVLSDQKACEIVADAARRPGARTLH